MCGAMRGLLQVMAIFTSFAWVLFLVPVQLWGEHVCVGMRGKHAFVVGLLFSTRIGEGVFVV